jgi:hypothetical protein
MLLRKQSPNKPLAFILRYRNGGHQPAKRREQRDSAAASRVGDTLTNMRVLASPPKQFCSSHVSLELR